MAVVALVSIKGAPGVTTMAVALGAVWPAGRPAVVAELDPAGGDLSARHGLAAEPSVVTLASELRRDRRGSQAGLAAHCQMVPGGVRVLAGTPSPAEMRAAAGAIAPALAELAAEAAVDVMADCGRLEEGILFGHPGEPGANPAKDGGLRRLIERADLVVVLTRTELADLSHVQVSLPLLRSLNDALVLHLAGDLRWRAEEIGTELGVEVIGQLPHDPAGAAVVGGQRRRASVRRLPLLRSAQLTADRMIERLAPLHVDDIDEVPRVAELHDLVPTSEVVT